MLVSTDTPRRVRPDGPAPPARPTGGRRIPVQAGLRRVAGITGSLVGTQALTSVLGLVFWTLAARTFVESEVGVAGAAVSMMMLLGTFGSLGLGTLLIARLPITPAGQRRVLVRTCLAAAGAAAGLLALVVPPVAVHAFGAQNLAPLVDTPAALAGLVVGTALFSVTIVLDQSVLTIGIGSLQLERNIAASVIKVLALLALSALGVGAGMAIFLAWTIGSLLSLPLIPWRTRAGRGAIGGRADADRRWIAPAMLPGLGRDAMSHHALNITVQAALQILPILVTVLLTAQDNAYFNSAVLLSGFVFALPYAITIGLFAAAGGDERQTLQRMRVTIPVGLIVSLGAYLVLFPFAGVALSLFGSNYAEQGGDILRVLVLAGLPFVVKDHYVALRRVQNRTASAVRLVGIFLVVELAAAGAGAVAGGTLGLCVAWVAVLFLEAGVLAVPLHREWRRIRSGSPIAPRAGRRPPGAHRWTASAPGTAGCDVVSVAAAAGFDLDLSARRRRR